jgi:phosphinothricin acetyltransferase
MKPSSDLASTAGNSGAGTLIACGERHAEAIQAIFNDAIAHSTALYDYAPRPRAAVAAWIEAKRQGNYPILGIETDDGSLAGFASYGPFRPFPAYKYTIEHSVYVERSRQG